MSNQYCENCDHSYTGYAKLSPMELMKCTINNRVVDAKETCKMFFSEAEVIVHQQEVIDSQAEEIKTLEAEITKLKTIAYAPSMSGGLTYKSLFDLQEEEIGKLESQNKILRECVEEVVEIGCTGEDARDAIEIAIKALAQLKE